MSDVKLIRKDGIYYIIYYGEQIQISESEAGEIMADHGRVYDIIIARKRKFGFSTSEDDARYF